MNKIKNKIDILLDEYEQTIIETNHLIKKAQDAAFGTSNVDEKLNVIHFTTKRDTIIQCKKDIELLLT